MNTDSRTHPVLTPDGQFLAPYLPKQEYLIPAWLGCMRFCLSQDEIVALFRRDTGNTWEPGRTPLEEMIDEATGVQQDFLMQFAAWMNAEVWGDPDASQKAHP